MDTKGHTKIEMGHRTKHKRNDCSATEDAISSKSRLFGTSAPSSDPIDHKVPCQQVSRGERTLVEDRDRNLRLRGAVPNVIYSLGRRQCEIESCSSVGIILCPQTS